MHATLPQLSLKKQPPPPPPTPQEVRPRKHKGLSVKFASLPTCSDSQCDDPECSDTLPATPGPAAPRELDDGHEPAPLEPKGRDADVVLEVAVFRKPLIGHQSISVGSVLKQHQSSIK